jgi:transcriptional regulator with XRE-family HTH domain
VARFRKPKSKPDAPDVHVLCAAVRSLRAKLRLSQQEMAARLNIAPMTLSRFERGVQVPRDTEVLISLRNTAQSSHLGEEFLNFQGAVLAAIERESPYEVSLATRPGYSAEQWELVQCARIAATHFPKEAEAMRKAAGEALRLVKQVIKATDFSVPLDDNFYAALEQRIDDLADQTSFEKLKEEGNQ